MEFIRPRKPSLSLDMAPLIDIVFQLLIFFMLSSSFATPSMRLDLPKAVSQDEHPQEEILVSIDSAGEVYLNSRKTELSTLRGELSREIQASAQKAVSVRGDKDMPYRYFVEVMDMARQAGAGKINILHESAQGTTKDATE